MKGGPLSVHSLNSYSKIDNESRLGSRQSAKAFVYNPPVPIPQSHVIDPPSDTEDNIYEINQEPTNIEEEQK